MERVRGLDDLMLQINGATPSEACMKVFNVMFPYPKPLPIGEGDEEALTGFFDGMTHVDKNRANRDCLPEQLMQNIKDREQEETEKVLKNNSIEDIQDLLDIRQEVQALRSNNAALL